MARHTRGCAAQQLVARKAPQAIGADEPIALDLFAPAGAHGDDLVGIDKTFNGLAKVQLGLCALAHRSKQHTMQVGAVHGGIRRAVAIDRRSPQRQDAQLFATEGTAHLQPRRKRRHRLQRLLQAPSLQAPHDVGPYLHARPHFAECGGPFVQAHIQPCARRAQGGGQPANATASDQDLFSDHRAATTKMRSPGTGGDHTAITSWEELCMAPL